MDIFKTVLNTVLKPFYALPQNREIQDKVVFYLHRMIELLDIDSVMHIFPPLLNQLFAATNDQTGVRTVVGLLNNLVCKAKSKSLPLVAEMFAPLTSKVLSLIDNGKYDQNTAISEENRMKSELHKQFIVLLQSAFMYTSSAFTTPSMSQSWYFYIL